MRGIVIVKGQSLAAWKRSHTRGAAFGVTAHDDVHGVAPDAFMTLPHHTRTGEGEVQPEGKSSFPLACFALSRGEI